MQEENIDKLKQALVKNLKRKGISSYISYGGKVYSGEELALEVENETDAGISMMNSLILLALDLVSRGKETI